MTTFTCQLHGYTARSLEELRDHENEFHGGAMITTLIQEVDDAAS